jgi:sugar phosphate permease
VKTKAVSQATSRSQVFLAAWTLYAGYYFCRKNMEVSGGQAIFPLAIGLACFGSAYAIAQLVGGVLADRYGARRTALAGAGISVVCTTLLAWCSHPNLAILLQLGNGFGQGFGWPALLKLLGGWFHRNVRDHVLAWWSTSYILGGLLASSLTAWLVVQTGVTAGTGFHPAYLISSAILLCTAVFFYMETAGLPPLASDGVALPEANTRGVRNGAWREILANRKIRIVSGAYFFLKMTRYTLLFWLPNYLISNLDYGVHAAEHTASYFELFGFLGPLAVAYAARPWFGKRRMALGASMLFALAFLCLVHPVLASSGSFGMLLSISLMGILIHGADLLMSGMTVLDAVPVELHGRAIGFVNGVGSIGQALSPLLITVLVSRLGWTKLFDLFVFLALVSGAICASGISLDAPHASRPNRSVLEPSDMSM